MLQCVAVCCQCVVVLCLSWKLCFSSPTTPQRQLHLYMCSLHSVAVCCSVLQRVASVLPVHCGPVYAIFIVQNVRFIAKQDRSSNYISVNVLSPDCCRVLQCVAVCCSVLQCVAVCCSVLQSISRYKYFLHPQQCHSGRYTFQSCQVGPQILSEPNSSDKQYDMTHSDSVATQEHDSFRI